MVDPVCLGDSTQLYNPNLGHSYEKRAIELHLSKRKPFCPISKTLVEPFLMTNWALKGSIAESQITQDIWSVLPEISANSCD